MLSPLSADDSGKSKEKKEVCDAELQDFSHCAHGGTVTQRRTRVPDKPPFRICWLTIGSSFGRIRGIYEPLTILQRSAQVYEYANLLDRAAECWNDSLEEMKRVAGFVLSGYISCSRQKSAPYKSYVGETYELDRMEELGWRLISEQVSREPQTYVQWVEAAGWTVQDEYAIETKIRPVEFRAEGRAKGKSTLTMLRSGIILEHTGELCITNETTGYKCQLNFHNSNRKVTGVIKSRKGEMLEELEGNWGSHLKTENGELLWQCNELDDGAASYYGFSRFACQLNESDDSVAPTDSRRRIDVRRHEEGSLAGATEAKNRLKTKYIQYCSSNTLKPVWFDPPNPQNVRYTWNNKYWTCKQKQDWSECPRFFEEL